MARLRFRRLLHVRPLYARRDARSRHRLDPVIVITGWIVLAVMHHYFGARVPALGIVAGLVNLGLWLILLFCPSGDHVVSPPSFDDYKPRSPDRGKPASVASQRFAKASGQFGRRA